MYTELPKITRCCFCIPLRYGILVWGYLKLMFFLFMAFVIILRNVVQTQSVSKTELIVDAVAGVAFLIDITITIIFIIGAHKKNPKLLRIYYRYTIFVVIMLFIVYLIGIGMDVYACIVTPERSWLYMEDILEMAILNVGSLILNLYLVSLIKNEIVKLENNTKLSFTNNRTEPECSINIDTVNV